MKLNLQSLEELAREGSGGKRRALLHSVTECFFVGEGQHSDVELALFDDVIGAVIAEVEPLVRAQLAARLAAVKQPPPMLLLRLANDNIMVAEEILKSSPALSDADLERLAREQSQDHLAAIAARPYLAERITDILVVRGDDRVAVRVAGNEGARFSVSGFAVLADRAQVNEMLRERLAARTDLPDAIMRRIVPMIGEMLIAKIAAEFEAGAASPEEGPPPSGAARALGELLDLVARGLLSLDEAAAELADSDGAPFVAELLARRTGLLPASVLRGLFASSDEPVTVLCRAAGLNLDGYSAVLRMRRRRRRRTGSNPAQALTAFLQMPPETAQRVVRFLKVREGN